LCCGYIGDCQGKGLMNPAPDARPCWNLSVCSRGASWLVILFGFLGLAGWVFEIDLFKNAFQGRPSIVPNTAIAFVLAGFSLLWSQSETARTTRRRTAQACALAVTLIGGLTLCEYVVHWKAGIDLWLFRESLSTAQTPMPGRPSFLSALNFFLLGLALLLLEIRNRSDCRPADLLA